MNSFARVALRIFFVCGIVLACGGTTCTRPVDGVQYAKGYGYVVKVERRANFDATDRDFYFIFPTKERATEFYSEYQRNPSVRPPLREGEYAIDDEYDYPEYKKLTELLQPLPPPPSLNETEFPLAVPDLPQPIPQTPQ